MGGFRGGFGVRKVDRGEWDPTLWRVGKSGIGFEVRGRV